jgi:hypothetical protein
MTVKFAKALLLFILLILLFQPGRPGDSAAAITKVQGEIPPSLLEKNGPTWRALLLIFHHIDVQYIDAFGTSQHLTTSLSDHEIEQATMAFRQFPSLAYQYSEGQAVIEYDIVHIQEPITSITSLGEAGYWVSPNDINHIIDQYAPTGEYDSILVHWAQCNPDFSQCIPSFGWGWASMARDMTYATVANAEDWLWQRPTIGEPWLHEWLHAVCWFYQDRGYPMPENDADGASGHGYTWSPTSGWMDYYQDLMTGNVIEEGAHTGITTQAWQSGSIFNHHGNILADYFYSNTLGDYEQTGWVTWDSDHEQLIMGGNSYTHSHALTTISGENGLTVSAQVRIPADNIGPYDSIALALRDEHHEYWGLLAYGTDLTEKNNISIMHNETWGPLYPLNLSTGWYTVKVSFDAEQSMIRLKVWPDGENEPGWQLNQNVPPDWQPTQVGFRHYGGARTSVDNLFVSIHPQKVFLPMVIRR